MHYRCSHDKHYKKQINAEIMRVLVREEPLLGMYGYPSAVVRNGLVQSAVFFFFCRHGVCRCVGLSDIVLVTLYRIISYDSTIHFRVEYAVQNPRSWLLFL